MERYADVVVDYLDYEEATLERSPNTVRVHRIVLAEWGGVVTERKDDWTDPTLRTAEVALSKIHRRGAGGSYKRLFHSACNVFYRWAIRHGLATGNPWPDVPYPKYEPPLPEPLDADDCLTLAESARKTRVPFVGIRNRAMIYALWSTGCRIDETLALNAVQYRPTHSKVKVHGKGNRDRFVFVIGQAVEAIHDYLHARALAEPDNPALWLTVDGDRLHGDSVRKMIRKAAIRGGILQRVYPHLMRHSFATQLLDRGVDIRVIQELLGHRKIGTTQRYAQVSTAKREAAVFSHHPLADEEDD